MSIHEDSNSSTERVTSGSKNVLRCTCFHYSARIYHDKVRYGKQHWSEVLVVRETSDSHHHGGPPQLPVHHSTIVLGDLRGAVNWASIVPRDSSVSDSECEFLQSGTKLRPWLQNTFVFTLYESLFRSLYESCKENWPGIIYMGHLRWWWLSA